MLRVAVTTNISEKNGKYALGETIKCYTKYFAKNNFDIYLFHWASLTKGGMISKYYHKGSCKRNLSLKGNIDLIFTSELGKIYDKKEEFLQYLDVLENVKGPLKINSPIKMRGNLDKNYLLDLQKNNFFVVPTILSGLDLNFSDLKTFQESQLADDLIIKPRFFGEVGEDVRRVSSFKGNEFQEYLKKLEKSLPRSFRVENKKIAMIQPFLEEVKKGEVSLFYLGRSLSHSFQKIAKKGEIINMANGWLCESYTPCEEQLNIASKLIDYYKDENQVTRIDFIESQGKWLISEVERINPAPFLEELKIGEAFPMKLCQFFNHFLKSF